jgi:hypothetical protein
VAAAASAIEDARHLEVLGWRFGLGLEAGLSLREAWAWAESDRDSHELRALMAGGCPPRLIARIVRP